MHLVQTTGMSRSISYRDMSQVEFLVLSTVLLAWSGNHRIEISLDVVYDVFLAFSFTSIFVNFTRDEP